MVAVVPYEMPPTCGSRQPEPSTSQALSAAAAITGVPAGIPVAVLAAALTAAQHRAHRPQLGQLLAAHRQRLPLPVGRLRPRVRLEVERHVAHLRADRVDELAGQLPVQQARQQQHLVRARPGRGLVLGPPVDLGLALEVADRVADAGQAERRAPRRADLRHLRGLALVQPDQRGQRGAALRVDGHDGAALRGHRHAAHGARPARGAPATAGGRRGRTAAQKPSTSCAIQPGCSTT